MDSDKMKIHEQCRVSPESAEATSQPLTLLDMLWLRLHPVERIFFYTLPTPLSHPPIFFSKLIPILKTSLSHTLQHFPLLAGNVLWPHHSPNPIIQYTPGDAVSLLIAQSQPHFNHPFHNSPHPASLSRCLVPHLASSHSRASVLSLQITLFPNTGFCIALSTHHAVLDGNSSTLFFKAWASLSKAIVHQNSQSSPFLSPNLLPFFDRTVIQSQCDLGLDSPHNMTKFLTRMFPNESSDARCLKFFPFPPKLEDHVRATFLLTKEDLDKLRKRALSKWDAVEKGSLSSKPPTLSSFVLTCAHVLVCIAKAFEGVESEKHKFSLRFTVDCRARLEPPIPDNYFGNCLWGLSVDVAPLDFIEEERFVVAAKSIHSKIRETLEKGVFHKPDPDSSKKEPFPIGRVKTLGIAGSNRFGVYESDFGWGKPAKVEIMSLDRGLVIGLAESKDGNGGLEVGLVLNKQVMDLFGTVFHEELSHE
ncbi:hypothetical protein VNO78_04704 [Psophocarpus tetragonolobus]|uniref:Uncharacterized protein n=1 Tax=Psophocarpus tetragonolobus TaxID=3891 RepID=A0AAN9TF48_PSOTE